MTVEAAEPGTAADRRRVSWRPPAPLRVVPAAIGFALHGLAGFFVLASGLLAPLWAIVAMAAAWLGLLVLAVRLLRTRPWGPIAAALAMGAIWFATITLGALLGGWTP